MDFVCLAAVLRNPFSQAVCSVCCGDSAEASVSSDHFYFEFSTCRKRSETKVKISGNMPAFPGGIIKILSNLIVWETRSNRGNKGIMFKAWVFSGVASQERISLPVICAGTVIWKWGDMSWPRAVTLSSGGVFYLCQPTCASRDGTWHLPRSGTEHEGRQSGDAVGETISHRLQITLWCLLAKMSTDNMWLLEKMADIHEEKSAMCSMIAFTKSNAHTCSLLNWLSLLECTVCVKSLWPLHILYVWNFIFLRAACLGEMDLLLSINGKGFTTLWKMTKQI